MADVKWIKIVTDIFDDEKILLIESLPEADSIIVIWFKLLCLAGKQNNSGVFVLNGRIAYTDKMLASIFRRKETTVQMALQTFENFGMIEIIDGVITIPKWGKHQSLDQLESRKLYMKNYMQGYREKQKLLTACKPNGKANVSKAEEDKNKKENKNKKDIGADEPPKHFKPPSLEEITAYCKERKSQVDPKTFLEYFETSGWVDSKGSKVKNWKQKIITWEGHQNSRAAPKQLTSAHDYPQRTYTQDHWDKEYEESLKILEPFYEKEHKK